MIIYSNFRVSREIHLNEETFIHIGTLNKIKKRIQQKSSSFT